MFCFTLPINRMLLMGKPIEFIDANGTLYTNLPAAE